MTRFNKDLKVKYNNQINQRFNLKILISLGITYLHHNKFQILLIKLMVRVLLIIKKVYHLETRKDSEKANFKIIIKTEKTPIIEYMNKGNQ